MILFVFPLLLHQQLFSGAPPAGRTGALPLLAEAALIMLARSHVACYAVGGPQGLAWTTADEQGQ